MQRWCLFRRLRSAAQLDGDELWLTAWAIGWLVAARLTLATVGFARIRARLEAIVPGPTRGDGFPAAVRRAMTRAVRTIPGSSCLPQAVTAFMLLRRGGYPAELTIGVARNAASDQSLDAHAWVRSGSLLVTGDEGYVDVSRFTELARVGDQS